MKRELLTKQDITRILLRIAHEIAERNKGCEGLCLVGIQRGGVDLAKRLAEAIKNIENTVVPVAALDISFYRDDLNIKKTHPIVKKTEMPFDINNKKIVLVDDVIYTGRSIRAALDALMDFGRPAQVQLAVLIDRGHRELPIRADYVGKNIPTSKTEQIKVLLIERGHDKDAVVIQRVE
ncbi:MAG: bifunctional pyr operon transcriptional regulator/uracil phosphoribosyltransferase PyrR [Nitrospirae bacterium]|nr:bifunctional pyr operon transcriptional regulator/uracil phosphoribosyltransferase PyrR [Nitrospirota bacterium]MBF0534130.1 bifunctional pyr operon transcriptional regulator/uracil phosphoribosyltransferase PyrR [Nitrospirota bacterium]MBF0617017.1 bifunctional pyr operon transcriptional regulator/uracil phosphoribosyltransferase PyrR [Nitrospirota bacterium]